MHTKIRHGKVDFYIKAALVATFNPVDGCTEIHNRFLYKRLKRDKAAFTAACRLVAMDVLKITGLVE